MQFGNRLNRSMYVGIICLIIQTVIVLESGCSGGFTAGIGTFSQNISSGTGGGTPAAQAKPFVCENPGAVSSTPLLRLTKTQYQNTLKDLFGDSVQSSFAASLAQIKYDLSIEQPTEFSNSYQASHLSIFFEIALKVAEAVSSNSNLQMSIGGACLGTSAPNNDCYSSFVTQLGLKVLRRPVTASELATLNAIIAEGTTKSEKISGAIEYLLQSPSFLYRIESGVSGDGTLNSPFKLSQYEIASRLSYFIWDSMPDETLFELAKKGELEKPVVLQAQVNRMFADTRAREKVKAFASFWLAMTPDLAHGMRDFPTGPDAFIDGLNLNGLKTEVVREAQEYVAHIVFDKKGTYKDLLTSDLSFAQTDALASIYGHSKVTSAQPEKMTGGRRGLLMRSVFLANSSSQTSPIIRGVRVRARVMCIEAVAPGVDVTKQGPDVGTEEMIRRYSTRDRTDLKTSSPACLGCHTAINPVGFAFEGFDSFGRLRVVEKAYGSNGSLIATHPIDTHTMLATNEGDWNIQNAGDFVDQLADSSTGPACLVRQVYRYYQLRFESTEDQCRMAKMYQSMVQDQGSLLDGLKAFVLNDYLSLKRVN